MSALRQALADYLAVRRTLGFKLCDSERLLTQFITYLENRGEEHVTIEAAVAWATLPAQGAPALAVCPAYRRAPLRLLPTWAGSIHPDSADRFAAGAKTPRNSLPIFRERNLRIDESVQNSARVIPTGDLSDIDRSVGRYRYAYRRDDRP